MLPKRNVEVILDREFIKDILPTTVFVTMAPYGQTSSGNANTYVPTRALADMYPMNTGKSITDPTSGYDAKNPYKNRDPRLAYSFYLPGDLLPNGQVFNPAPIAVQQTQQGVHFMRLRLVIHLENISIKKMLLHPRIANKHYFCSICRNFIDVC